MAGGGAVVAGGGITRGSTVVGFFIAAFAAFGGILFGYDTGTIGGLIAMTNWLETFGTYDDTGYAQALNGIPYFITTSNKSLVVSILSAGTFFGAFLAAPFADILGRRIGLIASCAVFSLGVGLQLDTHWGAFVAGRAIAGLGVGLVSCIVPMYQSECAPSKIRGTVVGLYQLAITFGALFAALVLNATKNQSSYSSWRTPVAVQFAWAGIIVIGMILLPESPRYLITKGKEVKAKKALAVLMRSSADSEEVHAEYLEVSLALQAEREVTGNVGYLDCFSNGPDRHAFRTWTGILAQGFQQLTGINFIFYYGTSFFKASGIGNPFLITIACDVVNTGMTMIGVNLIDRIGRRPLLFWGAIAMGTFEMLIAIIGTADASSHAANQTMIAFTCLYIATFAISWGPIIWCITGEIFPNATRAKSMSLAVASNWLWNWGIGYATPYLVDAPTTSGPNKTNTANLKSKVFFIWGATCFTCALFTYFFIPEVKGLTLEQVDLLYRESSMRNSTAYNKKMKIEDETFTSKALAGEPGFGHADVIGEKKMHNDVNNPNVSVV